MFALAPRRVTLMAQLALTVLALPFLLPLWVLFTTSWRGEGIGNYIAVLQHPLIPRFFLNSTIVSLGTIVLVYTISLLAAYAFSKLALRYKQLLFNAVLVGLMIPGIAILVPLFVTVKQLNLFDNYLGLILPYTAFALPFSMLLMRNFIDGIPNELLDASRIDGCNTFTTLLWIIVPLSRPISVVVVVLTFLGAWNEYFFALIVMRDEEMRTITQAPQYFQGFYYQDTGKIFAALVLISLPVILLYVSLQRYFERGMIAGSLK